MCYFVKYMIDIVKNYRFFFHLLLKKRQMVSPVFKPHNVREKKEHKLGSLRSSTANISKLSPVYM